MKRISFGTCVRAAIVTGLAGGLFAGVHEGARSMLVQQHGPHREAFSTLTDLIDLMGYATFAYLGLIPLALIIAAPLIFLAVRVRGPQTDLSSVYGMNAGLFIGGWVTVFQVFLVIPYITPAELVKEGRLQQMGWFLLLGLLAGVAAGFLVDRLHKKMGGKRFGMLLLSVYPALLLASLGAVWLVRFTSVIEADPIKGPLYSLGRALAVVAIDLAVAAVVGVIIYRIYRALGDGGMRTLIRFALYALGPTALIIVTVVSGSSAETQPGTDASDRQVPSGLNLLLITIDTVRADGFSCYGYERLTTPSIDAVAREGALFENVTAQSSWTLSSLASLVTSTYPGVHGIYTGDNRLDPNRITLAEILYDHGYNTGAELSNSWLQPPFGMNQGFVHYHCTGEVAGEVELFNMIWMRVLKRFIPGLRSNQREMKSAAPELTQRAMNWIEENRKSNFFFWVHYFDPHDPYSPPPGFSTLWSDGTYTGRYPLSSGNMVAMRKGKKLSRTDRDQIRLLYDQTVRATDSQIGKLLEKVEELGLKENTLVVIAGDHGEEFWEHEGTTHGSTTYSEVVFTPLIFSLPGVIPAGTRIEVPVSNLDIPPTVLDLLEVPCDENCSEFQGRSLSRELLEPDYRPEGTRYHFTEAMIYFAEKKAVTDGEYRFVLTPSSGRKELYNLLEDPAEQENIVTTHPEVAAQFEEVLLNQIAANQEMSARIPKAEGEELGVDPELVRQLRAMGYLQ